MNRHVVEACVMVNLRPVVRSVMANARKRLQTVCIAPTVRG